jgi:hypothetical protein
MWKTYAFCPDFLDLFFIFVYFSFSMKIKIPIYQFKETYA